MMTAIRSNANPISLVESHKMYIARMSIFYDDCTRCEQLIYDEDELMRFDEWYKETWIKIKQEKFIVDKYIARVLSEN